jgi:hypothetical protein
MRGSRKKTKRPEGKGNPDFLQLRKGMPARDSVEHVVELVSNQNVPYKILKTRETDAYDPPLQDRKKRTKR